jgi:aminoglycoside phosphotransferase (APT) family kinase protein
MPYDPAVETHQASRFGPRVAERAIPGSVGEPLLAFLCNATGNDALTYLHEPSRITGGFDTTIWAFQLSGVDGDLAGPLIVRVFRGEPGIVQATYETIAQNIIAGQGYPAPPVLLSCGDIDVVGNAFTIMPRVPGKVMLERVFGPGIFGVPAKLAQMQARLHALDPEPMRQALSDADLPPELKGEALTVDWTSAVAKTQLTGLSQAATWIDSNRPAPSVPPCICHGDFHPLNIMMEGDEVTAVIDWSSMRIADPAWDVGAAMALFGHGPIDLPGPFIPLVNAVRNRLKARYLRGYLALRPLPMRSLEYYEAMRLLGFMMEVGQYRHSLGGQLAATDKPTAFNDKRVLAGIMQRFKDITGIQPSIPPDPGQA